MIMAILMIIGIVSRKIGLLDYIPSIVPRNGCIYSRAVGLCVMGLGPRGENLGLCISALSISNNPNITGQK